MWNSEDRECYLLFKQNHHLKYGNKATLCLVFDKQILLRDFLLKLAPKRPKNDVCELDLCVAKFLALDCTKFSTKYPSKGNSLRTGSRYISTAVSFHLLLPLPEPGPHFLRMYIS